MIIREYDVLFSSLHTLFEISNSETPKKENSENELLKEIELKRKVIEEKNTEISNFKKEILFFEDEMKRFEELQKEFKEVNEMRDKDEESRIFKMQEEILMLSQIKTDNSKTLKQMEKETEDLKLVLEKLSGEKSKEREKEKEETKKMKKDNERLLQMESGLKDKIKLLEDNLGLMKKQMSKMFKEKDKYHKKYNLMSTLNKGHETRINSIEKENKKLLEQRKQHRGEVQDLKDSMKELIQEVGRLGVKKEVLMEKMGHDARVTEQIEETDSLDDSLNETMNQDLKEIEMDFQQQGGLEELSTNERENLQIDETFEREIQAEEAHMKAVTGFGSNFMEESQLDLTADFLNMTVKRDSDLRSPDFGDQTVKLFDKEHEEELQKIYDKVSDSHSRRGRSRRNIRGGSTRSINKEETQKEFEKEIDAKIKKRQEEGLSKIYASQFRSTVYDSSKNKELLVSTLGKGPVHKSTFEFGIESRKVEMNLLKKTKQTIGELCKSMNQNLFQGNEMRKLEKGIERIKKVDDLVEWVFVYFTKKLTKMEGTVKNLKSDQCRESNCQP